MAADDSTDRHSGDSGTDRRYSPDVHRHLGLIRAFIADWQRCGLLPTSDVEMLMSIAVIEATDLLLNKYDPTKATVSTFLKKYLIGRIDYRWRTQELGQKRWANKWCQPRHEPRELEGSPIADAQFQEILQTVHPDLLPPIRDLAGGSDLEEVAKDYGYQPQELRKMLASELRQFLDTD